MKHLLIALFVSGMLVGHAHAGMIDQPDITNNVTVLKNTTQAQCKSSWNGQIAPDNTTGVSRFGTTTGIAVGMQSCSSCSFDPRSRNCVCKTCYGYFN